MPLPIPALDDLSWAELVTEARERIPGSAPAWTDHNVHDPGITVIELLAWLVEHTGYRLDQVPEGHRRRFLTLLGLTAAPARPATAVLSATTGRGVTVAIPEGWAVDADSGGPAPIRFTVSRGGRATAAGLAGITAGGVAVADPGGAVAPFRPLGPAGDGALVVELAPAAPAGPLTLWFRAAGPETAADTDDPEAAAAAGHHSVALAWQLRSGPAGPWVNLPAAAVDDGTAALTRTGFVRFDLPAGGATGLRATVAAGRYDRAPETDAVVVNALEAIQTFPRLDPPTGARRPEELVLDLDSRFVQRVVSLTSTDGAGAVTAWELVASPRTAPDRPLALVDPAAGTIELSDGRWARRPRPGEGFRVHLVDSSGPAGNLRPGAARWTLGPPGAHPAPGLAVVAPFGSDGGGGAETASEAMARAASRLWAQERLVDLATGQGVSSLDDLALDTVTATTAPDRAVTLLDHERCALAARGVRLARARAWAGLDPALPCIEARGTVTVVVVPFLPAGRPEPTAELLAVVRTHLRRRKLVGSRLRVVGPGYTPVSVRVVAEPAPGADPARVAAEVEAAVRRFLDPLVGGPAGRGWPFGRSVYRTEVMTAAGAAPGVALVTEVELTAGSGVGTGGACRSVCVAPTHLVEIAALDVEVAAPAGEGRS